MPPTVMTPWFTPCCGLDVGLVADVVEPGAAAPELDCAPPLVGADDFVFEPELACVAGALWLTGAVPPLGASAAGVLLPPPLAGSGALDVASPLGAGAAVPEPETSDG